MATENRPRSGSWWTPWITLMALPSCVAIPFVVWVPRKLLMLGVHENPKICPRKPQMRKFGQRLSCDFQNRKYFGFLLLFRSSQFLCSLAIRIMSLKSDKTVWISNLTTSYILWISWFLIERLTSISPQICKRVSKFGPSNSQKRDRDLMIFRPQIRKIADTNHQELPGECCTWRTASHS